MDRFSVVLDGVVAPGADRATVLRQLAELFAQPEATAERLLAGRPVIVKRDVDRATGDRYVQRLAAVGAPGRLEPAHLELDADFTDYNAPVVPPAPPTLDSMRINPSATASAISGEDADLWTAIAQKNVEYYVPRWQRYAVGGSMLGWHWPALFIPVWWALYRKLWAAAVVFYLGVPFAAYVSAFLLLWLWPGPVGDSALPGIAFSLAFLVTWFAPPLLANGFSYRKARALLAEARENTSDRASQIAYLTGKGGPSGAVAVVAGVLLFIPFLGIMAGIAIPAYQDYVVRAKVNEVLAATAPLKTEITDSYARTGRIGEHDLARIQSGPAGKHLSDLDITERGAIVMTLGFNPVEGKRLAWVPAKRDDEIVWRCRNFDLEPKFVPSFCRDDGIKK